jgi:hypothetical protein
MGMSLYEQALNVTSSDRCGCLPCRERRALQELLVHTTVSDPYMLRRAVERLHREGGGRDAGAHAPADRQA